MLVIMTKNWTVLKVYRKSLFCKVALGGGKANPVPSNHVVVLNSQNGDKTETYTMLASPSQIRSF